MIGIFAAMRLAQQGCSVDLYESRSHIGGLSDAYTWQGVTWDRFYHVVLSTDERLIALLRELDLEHELFWRSTKTGFYRDGRLVSMSSITDFVTFPFLSLWQKFRLGLGILLSARIKNPDKLERMYVREWLTRIFGRRVYERIWDPLLRSKFGEARNRTSASFMWVTINRLYGARTGEAKVEQMGHVRGGYATILEALRRRLEDLGVRICADTRVCCVQQEHPTGLKIVDSTGGVSRRYDQVLLTTPAPEVLRLLGRTSSNGPYWEALERVEYLSVLCLFVVLDRRLSSYYVTNLLDTTLPFTGIVEVTNIVDPAEFGDRHIVYLPKYATRTDPVNSKSDDTVTELFLAGLRKVFPDLPSEAILHTQLFREQYVQPLQEVNTPGRNHANRTPLEGVYVANSTMIHNSTLNNNAAIEVAERAVAVMSEALRTASARP